MLSGGGQPAERHLPRTPATWLYQVGVARGDTLVGVIIVGRPTARATAASEPRTGDTA